MRVLTVNVHYSPQSYGGATIVAEEITRELTRRGHQTYVLTGTTAPSIPVGGLYRYEDQGSAVLAIHRPLPASAREEYSQAALGERFSQVLASVRPDVVHFHAIQALGVEMVERAIDVAPTFVTLHDAWWLCERQFMVRSTGRWCGQIAIDPRVCATCVPDPAAHQWRQDNSRRILNSCTRLLTPSGYWRNVMRASGLDGDRLVVNPNGVHHPAPGFRRSAYSGPVRFGYVGGDNQIKGAPQLRRALESMTRSDYRLLLADSALNLGHQTLFPKSWEYSGQIEIIPGYDYSSMDAFFDSIDVLLFPSQARESYGLTVREALLRGVWVVATDGGGTAEVLADGVNAHLLSPDQPAEGLRSAMEQILDDPPAYVGRARPLQPIPTFSQQTDEIERLYRAAV